MWGISPLLELLVSIDLWTFSKVNLPFFMVLSGTESQQSHLTAWMSQDSTSSATKRSILLSESCCASC